MEIPLMNENLDPFHNPHQTIYANLGSVLTRCALILAAVAAFTAAASTATLVVIRYRRRRRNIGISIPHPSSFEDYVDDDDDSCCSSTDEEEEEDSDGDDDDIEEEEDIESDDEIGSFSGDCEDGSDEGRSTFWPEIGGAVVKAWDGGLGLGFCRTVSSSNFISLFDLDRSETLIRSFLSGKGEIPAVNFASPAVLLSTVGSDAAGKTRLVRVWDARSDGEAPAIASEWRPALRRRIVGVSGGEVYVRDDAGEVTAVDLRRFRPSTVGCGSESVVSWCRSAAKCLTLLPLSE